MASSGSSGYTPAGSSPAPAPESSQADGVTCEVVQRVEEPTVAAQGTGSMDVDVDTANGADTRQQENEQGNRGDAAASTWVFIRELHGSAAREGRNFAVFAQAVAGAC